MARATDYWSYARECEHWAAAVTDEQDRRIFLDMASAWVKLALEKQSAFRNPARAAVHRRWLGSVRTT
jgi:hypothetical protein